MDFNQIMKQAQEMQKKLEEAQKKYIGKEFQGISGGAKVSVTAVVRKIGSYTVKKVNIDESLKNEEKDILEDMLVAAFNDAIKKAEEEMANASSDIAGMMNIPPGFKLPF
ncbi:YbaB/EbfC family nucleoid-associated protein [Wolbachia endosymbiont of Chironomus riparius]|uniref:YbaB/EbfC family nucleoid-associated protein n=1 Tax=Wolbachia endosymbiont of Chironomus riparius TaxID=2883238 RepID=UPI0020A205B7|nr:YbaB/EbfC family nucleoid-associated protein [Wolbachia endosymbiont of Chironomus riparius]